MPAEPLFELRRRTFPTPEFRGITCIETEARSIINKVGGGMPFDWTINPYRGCTHACVYCFARPTHTFLDMDAGKDFETKIVVKVNAPEVLRRELSATRWKGEPIAMGTGTDPYQRVEGRYRLMRGILQALIDHRNPFSILTKGTLILRDIDLLKRGSEVASVSAAFSIGTLDEGVWRATEPGTPSPKARLDAVRQLSDAGIPTSVLIAPVLPGISDGEAQLRDVIEGAMSAGAVAITPIMLHLRPGVREEFMPWLESTYPDLAQRYRGLYPGSYAPRAERAALSRQVSALARRAGFRPAERSGRFTREGSRRQEPPRPRQTSLW